MKVVVAVTGASGSLYAKILLEKLLQLSGQIEAFGLVLSKNAHTVWNHELGFNFPGFESVREYSDQDFNAPFASGSANYQVMIVIPCSMGTMGRIAHGISDGLITRAADVMLKERRKLILVPREMPLGLIQIENMRQITLAGGIICPASPSFYSRPATFEELASTVVDRVLDLAGFQTKTYRWEGSQNKQA